MMARKPPVNPLWRTPTHRAIWTERWCDRCVHPDQELARRTGTGAGCPILASAVRTGRKPKQWTRVPNAPTLDSTLKCDEFRTQPDSVRRGTVPDETLAMFDVQPITPDVDHA
ncbi:hypothetical protein SEA_TELAVIV_8 [Mycobacterium phage TelAviv]|nr:hypothetical protein SEA_TELAVIV_8 [Mycobacterium phage TelAviv]